MASQSKKTLQNCYHETNNPYTYLHVSARQSNIKQTPRINHKQTKPYSKTVSK